MPLKLTIENFTNLPDGGPLSFTMRSQTQADIGRDQHLDWSLPDTQRYISSKHCEIKRDKHDYLLVDVSTNGTYVNGASTRVQSPYRLKDGDRLQIGEYLIAVSITGDDGHAASSYAPEPAPITVDRAASYDSLWDSGSDVAPPPIDPKQLKPRQKASPVYGDFLYRAADVPTVDAAAQFTPADTDMWAASTPQQPVRDEAPRAPEPRRKAAPASWDDAPAADVPPAEPPPVPQPVQRAAPPPEFTPQPAPVAPPPLPPMAAPNAPPPPPASFAPPAAAAAPQPAPHAAPPSAPSASPAAVSAHAPSGAGLDAFIAAFAQAAGVPPELFRGRSAEELGAQLGRVMLAVAGDMQQLLQARVQAKRLARSSEHTMIQPQENNPLKFTPTPQDALRIMLGPQTRSYLDAERALAKGFEDIKRHELQTYTAMQQAVAELFAQFDPAKIEAAAPPEKGIAGLMKSHKSALWDAYVAAWEAQTRGQADGVISRFMLHFGGHYDRAGGQG